MIRHAPSIGLGLGLSLRGSGVGVQGLLDLYTGAAAAYSLRALTRNWVAGDVVEVRRSSDSTTQGFTANQITSGAMLDFVNNSSWTSAENSTSAPYTTFTGASLSGFTATLSTGVAFGGFGGVSGVSGQTVSVSFDVVINSGSPSLALRTSKSVIANRSNFVTLTESGSYTVDLTATDAFGFIGFSEGDAGSDYTISNFEVTAVSGEDGFVSTWYDQSGNGNDATQITTTSQPKIVSAGSLVTGGLDFDGVDDRLEGTSAISSTDIAIISVCKSSDNTVGGIVSMLDAFDDGQEVLFAVDEFRYQLQDSDLVVSGANTNESLLFANYDGTNQSLSINGSLNTQLASKTVSVSTTHRIGGRGAAGYLNGTIAEVIIYNSDQSASRVGIETNINDAYSIY